MSINSGDIINYNSDIYLSQDYILEHTEISYSYLRVAKSRFNKGTSDLWKFKKILNKDYLAYNNLPISAQTTLLPLSVLIDMARNTNDEVAAIIEAARLSTYNKFLSNYNLDEMAVSAAIIHEACVYVSLNKISFSKSAFFKELEYEIEVQEIKHLPKTWRNLRDKIREYADGTEITELIRKKNKGNSNSTEFANNDTIKAWLISLIESQKNYSAAHIHREIRRMSIQSEIDKYPSVRWIRDFINDPSTQYITQERYGVNTRFNAKYRVYTPTKSAVFAGDCWQIDGTRNIIDHRATYVNKAGKKVTGQKFLYIIAVRDVMSGMVLGWEYCYEESAQATINAVAMAVCNAGYLPYEFIYDRFPGHNSQEWKFIENQMRIAGTIMTITHKAEGKAHIERWWSTLQSVFMMDTDLFYGEGIKSTRRYAHRSKEYVASMRSWAVKNSFNYDMACRETDKIISSYIDTPLSSYSSKFAKIDKSPSQLHESSDKPNTYGITDYNWCFMFGLSKEIQVANHMITTQIEGAKCYYGVDDCDVIEKYTGVKLINCFDYEDLSIVHLFNGNEYVGSFFEIEPAQRFGPDKDMRAVGRIKSIAEKVKKDQENKRMRIKEKKLILEQDVASEVSMMQGGIISKHTYENAETAFLLDEWDSDEQEISITAKDQY